MQKFNFEGYDKHDRLAVLDMAHQDMAHQIDKLGDAICNKDLKQMREIYDYLGSKQRDYATSGYDNYEIITCCDLTGDAIDALESGSEAEQENVKKLYNYLYKGGPEPEGITW